MVLAFADSLDHYYGYIDEDREYLDNGAKSIRFRHLGNTANMNFSDGHVEPISLQSARFSEDGSNGYGTEGHNSWMYLYKCDRDFDEDSPSYY